MGDGSRPTATDAFPIVGPGPRLVEIVEGMLIKNGVTRPISLEEQLTDVGLTSFDMANLMLAVEAEFDITIPAAEITPLNFRCLRTIEALIVRARQSPTARSR